MMNTPKVSVIIPVYNAAKYIERCVRSLFNQTLDDMEYIFVDDCTPDESISIILSILEEYTFRKDQVKIIHHKWNTGQSGARRDGMAIASGEYIIHCDADDWVDVEMYKTMYDKAIEMSADSVSCDVVMEYASHTRILKYNSEYCDHKLMRDCIAPISVEYCSMCNRLVSNRIYKEHTIAPFAGVNMWDDVGLSIRVRYYCDNNAVINIPFYHYNQQNIASTTRRPLISKINEQIECVKQLELFFGNEGELYNYKRFIALLKLVAKDELLNFDAVQYKNVFQETRKYLYVLKCQCSWRQIIKRYLFAYFGRLVTLFSTQVRRTL